MDKNHYTNASIDLRKPEIQANPFDTYKLLREKSPVCFIEKNDVWVISSYEHAKYALKNYSLFSSAANNRLFDADWLSEECRNPRLIAAQDPPEHTKYQYLLKKSFSDKTIKSLIPFITNISDDKVKSIKFNNTIDFVEFFSFPVIGRIIRHLTGIDDHQSLDELREWITLESSNSPTKPSDDFIKKFQNAVKRQNEYFICVANDRKKQNRYDFVSKLVRTKVSGRPLTNMELASILSLIVSAALVGTVQTLNHCIIELSNRPHVFEAVSSDHALIPRFIEEILRYCTPAHSAFRKTTCDVIMDDAVIPKNSYVLIVLASANRDQNFFSNPDEFDIYRYENKHHLAFGYGIHRCLGAKLAQLEITIALTSILNKFKGLSCPDSKSLKWLDSGFMRGVSELPVTFY